jgi:formylglycine-generating enzyme required for sulfatase activity
MTVPGPGAARRDAAQPDLVAVPEFPFPFLIGRYPVTMAEYWDFLDDTGWRKPRHWPAHRSPMHNRLPVSWVDHFDANAYCYWLTQRHRLLVGGFFLPSMPMIRAAARSAATIQRYREEWRRGAGAAISREEQHTLAESLQEPMSSMFPWGDRPDPQRCNCSEFRPHRPGPTPVDQFGQAGVSGYGVADLSGNLWEMTSTFRHEDDTRSHWTMYSFYDAPHQPALAFRGWAETLGLVTGRLASTKLAWEFKFDIVGGSYGTAADGCRTDMPGAWTSAANFGPYSGFRVARFDLGRPR